MRPMRASRAAILLALAIVPLAVDAKPDAVPALSGKAKARSIKMRAFANAWLGTPYLWGGETKDGIDCSGYQRELFRKLFNLELPRTTHDQIHLGLDVPIRAEALGKNFQPGDLFFYVDATGTPNHVVTYLGEGLFTHSAGGRGVVVEGFQAIWGRRIVGRRVLVPARGDEGGGAIPAAGPLHAATVVPCPPSITANPEQVRRYLREPIADMKDLGLREICDWRALGSELKRRGGPEVEGNLVKIDQAVRFLESIEYLEGTIDEQR
jgi:hypothetical protein